MKEGVRESREGGSERESSDKRGREREEKRGREGRKRGRGRERDDEG